MEVVGVFFARIDKYLCVYNSIQKCQYEKVNFNFLYDCFGSPPLSF